MHVIAPLLVALLGLLQMASGLYSAYFASSATHELLAVNFLGFGTLSVALAILLRRLDQLRQIAQRDLANSESLGQRLDKLHDTTQRQLAIFDRLGKPRQSV